MTWLYFIAADKGKTPRVIARRDAVPSPSIPGHTSWGPIIQLLSHDSGWIDRPQLLTRFHDAGYLEPVTFEQARAAAEEHGTPWPDETREEVSS